MTKQLVTKDVSAVIHKYSEQLWKIHNEDTAGEHTFALVLTQFWIEVQGLQQVPESSAKIPVVDPVTQRTLGYIKGEV